MAEESFAEQFVRLEEKIKEVVQRSRELQQTKTALESKMYELEEALKIKLAAEDQYVEEKSIIGARIEDLLTRLDQAVDHG